ncbi:DUF4332 domain-containing protein [Neorhodopirellula pilleata]|uniref:DUF4332 domain-containing protein n=1 Tax=Neorhodopirellula pilleata TaxID=2714738 RepID=A0A5C5ZPC4_9BACT|nr:DUF4332 domain-containing protein [Neorhodopirellula pilleata]TWT89372.1 hypothetical protein Pla100_55350 [Neorhodopirellula pilleata]
MFEFLKKIGQVARHGSLSIGSTKSASDVTFWVDMPSIPDVPDRRCDATPRLIAASDIVPQMIPCENAVARGEAALRNGSHRERLLAMKLEHLQFCPPRRCHQLADVGVQTAGDLVYSDLPKIASRLSHPERAERALRRYRAAIRMSLAIDTMMPRDALLLVAIHRRSVASLSRESAAQLHRDLERFSLSSRGSKLLGNRGVPSLRRVKAWVSTCRHLAEHHSAPNTQPALQ